MLKTSYLLFITILVGSRLYSQTLYQPANWPNADWVVYGSFNSSPKSFEADPRVTPNFAFDDRGEYSSEHDQIIAESPVIDLTDAFNAGETLLSLEVQYNYKDYSYISQYLTIEYWVESLSFWFIWDEVEGNINSNDNYCYREKFDLLMSGLDISSLSAEDLRNFKYRIVYSDPADDTYGWGFCFNSPVLKSNFPVDPPDCAINPNPADDASDIPNMILNVSWEPSNTGASPDFYQFYYGVNDEDNLSYVKSLKETSIDIIVTSYSTDYYFKVVPVNLAGTATDCPIWHFTSENPPPTPDNDICSGAIPIEVQPQDSNCSDPILMNNHSANNSSDISGIPEVTCTNQDTDSGDLWFSFKSPDSGKIKIVNKWTGDLWFQLGFAIYDDCSATNEIACGVLEDGHSGIYGDFVSDQTYYLRIFDSSTNPPWDAIKYFCIETYNPPLTPPENDECENAIELFEQFDKIDYIATTPYAATIDGATDSGIPITDCTNSVSIPIPNDDVWFKFVAETESLSITIDDDYSNDCTIELFSGDCDNLNSLACASASENPTIEATDLSIGSEYYVRVFSDLSVIPPEPDFKIAVWTSESNVNKINSTFKNFSLYPNPTTHFLYIEADEVINQIRIYNLQGQRIFSKTNNEMKINLDISNLKSGYYLIRLDSKNKEAIYPLLIK